MNTIIPPAEEPTTSDALLDAIEAIWGELGEDAEGITGAQVRALAITRLRGGVAS